VAQDSFFSVLGQVLIPQQKSPDETFHPGFFTENIFYSGINR
jgi:hypothetical protein